MSITQPEISVIVPIYNKAALTSKCLLLNLAHSIKPIHWILIDNNSDQETKAVLLHFEGQAIKKGHSVNIITEVENTGVAIAWNKGLTFSKSLYSLVLNNDCVMQPSWDIAMIEEAQLGQLQLFSPLVFEPQFFKKEFTLEKFLENDYWKILRTKNANRYYKGYFSGIVLFANTMLFKELGGFDEQFWLSLEDIDFEARAKQKGYSIGLSGNIVAYHYVSATRKTVSFSEAENKAKFVKKWGWNYCELEHTFLNKKRRSYKKWLMRNFQLISNYPEKFPV